MDRALRQFSKCFAIDVTGNLRAKIQDCPAKYSMASLIKALTNASRDALQRRQEHLFHRLVRDVMLPFYEEHQKIGYLRDNRTTGASKMSVPPLHGDEGLLQLTLSAGDLSLMGHSETLASPPSRSLRGREDGKAVTAQSGVGKAGTVQEAANMRRDLLRKDVMDGILARGTATRDGVFGRWEYDEGYEDRTFQDYRKPGSRQLGHDLTAQEPQGTLLTDLIIPELAFNSVLPLQMKLREMAHTLINEPIGAMFRMLSTIFTNAMQSNTEAASDEGEKRRLESLMHVIITSLEAWHKKEIDARRNDFEERVAKLQQMHMSIIKSVFSSKMPQVFKVKGGNKNRKTALGKQAPEIAKAISEGTLTTILNQVLSVINVRLRASFEAAVREMHRLMQAAIKKGDTTELEASGAFAISQHYARFTAGLIAAVEKSELAKDLLANYKYKTEVLELAAGAAIMISGSQGLEALLPTLDDEMSDQASDDEVDGTAAACSAASAAASPWACEWCGCTERDEAGVLLLSRPCRFNAGSCWCENIDLQKLFCRRCVKYYKDKSVKMGECTKREAKWEKQYQKKRQTQTTRKRSSTSAGLMSPPAEPEQRRARTATSVEEV